MVFRYDAPKEKVIACISEVLDRPFSLFDPIDLHGKFMQSDAFYLRLNSSALLVGRIVGQVVPCPEEQTEIHLKPKVSWEVYSFLFALIAVGIAFMVEFAQTGSWLSLFKSFGVIIGGLILSIGGSRVSFASIHERYMMFIDKKIRAI